MQKSIIVCDDDKDLVELLASYLERKGFLVRCAHDCESVWPLISDQRPDFVLMDVKVPVMGGEAATIALKKQWGSELSVILISGESVLKDVASRTHADGYVQKPFKVQELMRYLGGF